jgi:GNAT superfamily N-acetyltransferase
MEIKYAQTEAELLACWDVVRELRPHLTDPHDFLRRVKEMTAESYRILYVAVKEGDTEKAVAFTGFRDMQMLYTDKMIYIDDLATLPEYRGNGYASRLLDKVYQIAKDSGKAAVHLDSGYQRKTAHRVYLQKGFELGSHHFVWKVG